MAGGGTACLCNVATTPGLRGTPAVNIRTVAFCMLAGGNPAPTGTVPE